MMRKRSKYNRNTLEYEKTRMFLGKLAIWFKNTYATCSGRGHKIKHFDTIWTGVKERAFINRVYIQETLAK